MKGGLEQGKPEPVEGLKGATEMDGRLAGFYYSRVLGLSSPVASFVLFATPAWALFVPANLAAVFLNYSPLLLAVGTSTCRGMIRIPTGSWHETLILSSETLRSLT